MVLLITLREGKQMTNETLKIDGITYNVVRVVTPESAESDGLVNLAQMMREHGKTRQLFLQRPKGKVHYFVNEFKNPYNGRPCYGEVVSLGAFNRKATAGAVA